MVFKIFGQIVMTSILVGWASPNEGDPVLMVEGKNFRIPATQQIKFVQLKNIDPDLFNDTSLPRVIDLRSNQSSVKSQGQRGACTYFALTGLAESLIKRANGKDIDLSEEYLAWAAKTQLKMRAFEEDSSVAVNAAALQKFGFMLERDLPYQPSWFSEGFPCEGQMGQPSIDPICYSHYGPESEKQIIVGEAFLFKAVDSSSIDVVRSLALLHNPVHLSILGHGEMWKQTYDTGDLLLTKQWKKECQISPKLCGGHAVLAVGYDLDRKRFFIKNSWGEEWGQSGYGTISFDYIDQMSDRKFLTGYLKGKLDLP